jgi:hypothetical protein
MLSNLHAHIASSSTTLGANLRRAAADVYVGCLNDSLNSTTYNATTADMSYYVSVRAFKARV